jgi:hypothetical protein
LLATAEEYDVDSRSRVNDDKTTLWLKYRQWLARLAVTRASPRLKEDPSRG